MKILVVHKEESVLAHLKLILRNCEQVIRFYNSGLDGLMAARMEEFNLIICGTELPIITGYELIRSLRINSINASTTVIFISDEIDTKVKYLGAALGVAGMLSYDNVSTELESMVALVHH